VPTLPPSERPDQSRISTGCAATFWFCCPGCGRYAGPDYQVLAQPVGFAPLQLIEAICHAEKLLSLVIVTVAIFLRWLRMITVVPFTIAVAQRQFFTTTVRILLQISFPLA
jgi:hypothetical protein